MRTVPDRRLRVPGLLGDVDAGGCQLAPDVLAGLLERRGPGRPWSEGDELTQVLPGAARVEGRPRCLRRAGHDG